MHGHEALPRHGERRSLGQIHSALAYYWDHQDELDRDIARRLEAVEGQQRRLSSVSLRARLRAPRGLMPLTVYMDQHVPRAITTGLRLRNVDVLTGDGYRVCPSGNRAGTGRD